MPKLLFTLTKNGEMPEFLGYNTSLELLNTITQMGMSSFLGIEFTEIGTDYLIAKMPVNERTTQPMGILHGGASVVLAESIGSIASNFYINASKKGKYCVGQSINANHIRPANEGFVYAKCSPLHLGKTSHVWNIEIKNEAQKLICQSRLTMAVIK